MTKVDVFINCPLSGVKTALTIPVLSVTTNLNVQPDCRVTGKGGDIALSIGPTTTKAPSCMMRQHIILIMVVSLLQPAVFSTTKLIASSAGVDDDKLRLKLVLAATLTVTLSKELFAVTLYVPDVPLCTNIGKVRALAWGLQKAVAVWVSEKSGFDRLVTVAAAVDKQPPVLLIVTV